MTVEQRLEKMGGELRALRVLYDHHDSQIQQVAEVQGGHGKTLEEHGTLLREIKNDLDGMKGDLAGMKLGLRGIYRKLAPLSKLNDFVRRVASEHESRISALEKHASPQ
jgi:hypothetical protein